MQPGFMHNDIASLTTSLTARCLTDECQDFRDYRNSGDRGYLRVKPGTDPATPPIPGRPTGQSHVRASVLGWLGRVTSSVLVGDRSFLRCRFNSNSEFTESGEEQSQGYNYPQPVNENSTHVYFKVRSSCMLLVCTATMQLLVPSGVQTCSNF